MAEQLTARERQVLQLVAEGKASKQVAFELGISFRTACCHRWRILRKLQAHNTAELIRNAVQSGVVDLTLTLPDAPVDPVIGRLNAILEENKRFRDALCRSIATSQSICQQAQKRRDELSTAVETSRSICNALMGALR